MFNKRRYSRNQLIMYKCEICGREVFKKRSLRGYKCLCSKHKHQLLNHGKFLDSNPRTISDPNEIIQEGDISKICLYNATTSDLIGFAIIDTEDIHKVQYHKWRLSHGRAICGSQAKGYQKDLGNIILGNLSSDLVVDHINGDPLDNRKENLRLTTQSNNALNKSKMSPNTSGIIGVSPDKRPERKNKWVAEIRYKNVKTYIGSFKDISEAAYARYCAEVLLFKEFRNTNQDEEKEKLFSQIPSKIKERIEEFVTKKIHNKFDSV